MRLVIKLSVIFIIVFSNAMMTHAQSYKIDSLQSALNQEKSKQQKSDINYALSIQLYNYDYNKGFEYAKSALKIAEAIKYNKGKVQALTAIGNYYYYIGDLQTAQAHYQKAIKISADEKLAEYPFKINLRLSILYRTKANFDSASYFLDQAKVFLPVKEQSSLHGAYYANAGILANHQSQNQKALRYLKKSLNIRIIEADTSRIADTWRNIGVSYMDLSVYDSAEFCFARAQNLLDLSDNPETRMVLLLNKGEMHFAKGEIEKAIENYNLSLDKLKANTYRKHYSKLLYNLGELYSNQNDYNTGFNYLFKAVSEFERLTDQQNLAKTFSTIGWNYIFQENFLKAKEYGEKSLKIVLAINDSAGISKSQNLIGFAALKNKDLGIALNYFDSAYTIRHHLGLKWGETYTMYNQALVFIELNEVDTAFKLLKKALILAESINNQSAIIYINNELGHLYSNTKDFKSAAFHLQEAQSTALAVPLVSGLLTNYKNYIALSELTMDKEESLKYLKLYVSLKDSTDHIISSGRIANADALFQVQKKTAELQTKIGENLLQQQKIGEQNKLIKAQKRTLIIVSISLLLLIILTTAIVRLLILRSKAKERLRKQNLAIQEQKEEILTQSEELIEANQHLATLNDTLSEKNVEIEAQSDLLSEINDNLEKQVAKRTKELSAAYKELETFFYKASHDFRRPLTTYLGLVEVAKSTLTDQEALMLFDKVKVTTVGLDNMIHKLQAIGNIDYKNELENISLSAIVNDYIEANISSIQDKEIEIILPAQTIELVQKKQLIQVIIANLLENAILFSSPRHPKIVIHWSQSKEETFIAIEDNGAGIAANVQPNIFEMFFRGNEASQGNGLGLYITKRAVAKLGGKITFESTSNVGTTFKVVIPNQA